MNPYLFVLFSLFYSFSFSAVAHEQQFQYAKPPASTQHSTIDQSTPKICLTMIVKNESAIIERCLDAALPILDSISICDTGSTDNTVELIEQYMKKHNLPGKVHHHTWKNFGHNRTASAVAAQETAMALGYPLSKTYLLLLDADMMLEIEPQFNKSSLAADSYSLIQRNGDLSYGNVRLIRASLPWKCIGVTHEYWGGNHAMGPVNLETLWIDDCNDGGCKSDKFERDLALLTQGLIDEPNNHRYMFYLAQTYRCLGQYENSNRWYQARVDAGGWMEEVWYSKLMIGENYESLGQWDKALEAYLNAYAFNPARAEPLHHIAKYYRLKKQNLLATLFAKLGSTIPYPKDQVLFINHTIYEYGFDEELSIAAYYTPNREEGWEASNRLLLNPTVPKWIKEQAYQNILFYVKALPIERITSIPVELPPLENGIPGTYLLSNSSILTEDGGYLMNCRTVNYKIDHTGGYVVLDKEGIVKTKNYLVHFDKNFNRRSQKEIVEDFPRIVPAHVRRVTGIEDLRLFPWKNKLWFTCNTRDTSEKQLAQVTLGTLPAESENQQTLKVDFLQPLSEKIDTTCEKNWLPLVKDNSLYFIYSYDPFRVLKLHSTHDGVEEAFSYSPDFDASHFRGSAPPIPYQDGYLLLIHEVVYGNKRTYLHRFVFLDKELKMTKLSKPFFFQKVGIEYSLGMAIDHTGTKLILPFTVEDKDGKLAWVDLKQLDALLEPIPVVE